MGKFNCSVRLSGQDPDVLFTVEPDIRYRCELSAIQFPSTLRSETEPRPVFLDTINGGRIPRPSAPRQASEGVVRGDEFTVAADRCWMRYWAALGKRSS